MNLRSGVFKAMAAAAIRMKVPPAWSNHRFIRTVAVVAHARHALGGSVEETADPDRASVPLPRNVDDRKSLPRVQGRWRRSFYDVPTRVRQPPSIISIGDGRVVSATSEWGSEHFALIGPGTERLTMSGTRWLPGHRAALKRPAIESHAEHVVWPWESWYQNHFHWTLRHLSKLAIIRERGLEQHLVLPHDAQFDNVHLASARHLGIDLWALPRMETSVLRAARLTVVDLPGPHPDVVERIRAGFAHLMAPSLDRRLYVRRSPQGRRRLTNEEAVWVVLSRWGFEPIAFEDLTFEAKVRACSEASVIIGLHGAGLANVVFSHPGTHLIEIIDPRYANPDFYELAAVSGLHYWLLIGEPIDGEPEEWNYGDVRLDPDALNRVLENVERSG